MGSHSLTAAQVEQYRIEGYVVVESVFSGEDLTQVDATIRELTAQAVGSKNMDSLLELEPEPLDGQPVARRIYSPYDLHAVFRDMANDPRLVDRIESLIGHDINLQHSKLNMKPARVGSPVDWHQDMTYFPHTNDDLVTTLVYLDEATEENGCLQVLPRHQSHYFDHTRPDGSFAGKIREDLGGGQFGLPRLLAAPAGSVIFMHCLLPHASLTNRSDHPRRTVIFEYRAADSFPIFFGKSTAAAETRKRLIRGKAAQFARFGGPPPFIPNICDQFASLYELQEKTEAIAESSASEDRS